MNKLRPFSREPVPETDAKDTRRRGDDDDGEKLVESDELMPLNSLIQIDNILHVKGGFMGTYFKDFYRLYVVYCVCFLGFCFCMVCLWNNV